MIKEKGILFSAPMVRAILDGRKTMTRRVVKPTSGPHTIEQVISTPDSLAAFVRTRCPYGQPGDRLWVRETHAPQADCWAAWHHEMEGYNAGPKPIIHYRADGGDPFIEKWRPAIHMPRFASRITLEITAVRVERLQDISEQDAIAEGLHQYPHFWQDAEQPLPDVAYEPAPGWPMRYSDPIQAFRALWESINGPGSWALNPWVWVVEFKRL